MTERQPLLHHSTSQETLMKRSLFSRANLLAPIDPKHGDLALLACCFVTGLLDCGVFNNYSVFVGMQTGMSTSVLDYEITSNKDTDSLNAQETLSFSA